MIVGPALGGIVVSSLGLGWAYGIDVATYVFALGFAFMLHPQLPHRVTEEMERGWSAVKEGLRYLRGKRDPAVDVHRRHRRDGVRHAAGAVPRARREQFGGGPEAVGWLFSAVAFGALVGALASGWVSRIRRQGLAVLLAVTLWGFGIIAFGLAGDRLVIAARVPRGRGRRGCHLRGLPLDDSAARRFRTSCAGGSCRSTSSSWPVARGSATSRPVWSRPRSRRRSRSSRAGCSAWPESARSRHSCRVSPVGHPAILRERERFPYRAYSWRLTATRHCD